MPWSTALIQMVASTILRYAAAGSESLSCRCLQSSGRERASTRALGLARSDRWRSGRQVLPSCIKTWPSSSLLGGLAEVADDPVAAAEAGAHAVDELAGDVTGERQEGALTEVVTKEERVRVGAPLAGGLDGERMEARPLRHARQR